jgi:hypothetical protein
VVVTPRHFAANAPGARFGWVVTLLFPAGRPAVGSAPSVRGSRRRHSVAAGFWRPAGLADKPPCSGHSYRRARVALNHPLARQWPDPEHSDDEDRSIVIGLSPGGRLLLIVTATGVNGKMRIISARRATKRERHAYQDG